MTPGKTADCFTTLGLSRAAAIDESALHRAYVECSRTAHPDHGGSEASAAQVDAAYETLRHPERRLKHLLELAGPLEATAWRAVPLDESMMRLFSELGKAMQSTTDFLERKRKAGSALAKALLAGEEMRHRETLENIGFQIDAGKKEVESGLPRLDDALANQETDAWKQVAMTQARLAYLAKWQTQIRETLLALM